MIPPAGGVLDAAERRTLAAVCDAFMPSLDATGDDSVVLQRLSAADVDLAGAVEQAMTALSARQLRELRLFLALLDSALFMLPMTGRAAGFTRMSAAHREAALLSLADSPVPAARTGFQALKRLATFLFYSVVDGRGGNPAWAEIGYALPVPAPGVSRLVITPITRPATFEADVCVVGSGAGGGVVAARLAEAGLTVVVLEAGPPDQAADFDEREIAGMQRLYLDQGTTATRDLAVAILAGGCVGGGTTVNWQTSLRLPDYLRDEWTERSGIRAFSDAGFTQALDAVCERLHVGTSESTRNGNNAPLERGCAALGYRWMVIPRNASGCDLAHCGYCVFGCRVGGKQSTANTYLVDAQRGGRTTLVAGCRASRLLLERGRASGVDATALDAVSGARHAVRVHAKTVVVAAGALETPALLLRSGIDHPQIGRNLFLHPTSGVAARYEDDVRGWIGAPQTVLCDELARRRGNYGVRVETAPLHPGLFALANPWHGAREHRRRMRHAARISGFIVLTRDRRSGRVTVDREGRPVARYTMGRMERELMREGIAAAARIHWAAGATEIHSLHTREHSFRRATHHRSRDVDAYCEAIARAPVGDNRCAVFSAHQMGTCRMGTDPRSAVCDERGGVHGVPGLHVADASLFPASSGVNPMITVMALADLVGGAIAAR